MKDGIWGFHGSSPHSLKQREKSHPVLLGAKNSGAILPREVEGRRGSGKYGGESRDGEEPSEVPAEGWEGELAPQADEMTSKRKTQC